MQTKVATSKPQTSAVLGKALDVLETIIWNEPMSTRELAEQTSVEKAAVYRILNTFVERGFATKYDATKSYGPGPKLFALAGALNHGTDIVSLAGEIMTQLRDDLGETVNFGGLVGREVQYLSIVTSSHTLRMSADVGSRDAVHSTALGKAILSRADAETVSAQLSGDDLPRSTQNTIVHLEELLADLAEVRSRGYAIDNEENELGAVCVAAPIIAPNGTTRYALSVSGPAARMTPEVISGIGPRLVEACERIASLGYVGIR